MSQPAADAETPTSEPSHPLLSAERLKAFEDAVVAIAMTLLILPLLESVSEFAREGKSSLEFVQEEHSQLFSFGLSFLIIAVFWMTHHRVFDRVEKVTSPLVWLQVGWMLTIVWLPVSTALLGAMDPDTAQKLLYIGALLASSLFMLATRLYLRRRPELHRIDPESLRRGIIAEIVTSAMFAIALLIAVLVPAIGYGAMFLLVLSGPVQALFARGRVSRKGRTAQDSAEHG
ncbi:TMEM175 family protein [Microbacterium sp. Au-Mic1]|uniref:TMEM175 family protein n=1 Tax=Microbacterium sp. Au-Mic1 TaxID=2906457 RepID=UPI001E4DF857|nr:TMEM175 family protein [Microbacterium sp. Au-Mic1]MCE4025382.1 TMEM175 family protein [Microbacterium sp. Au-Mic1]